MKPWPYPRIFAHRGGGSLAPENTLAAIRAGQSLGYAAHEIDVKLSRDGVAMLLHDDTLDRTTTGRGRAADLTWTQMLELDAGRWYSGSFAGERLPSLEDAANLLRANGTRINVEIKPTTGFEHDTGVLVAARTQELWKGAKTQPLLSSFSFESLMAAKDTAPTLPRGWLTERFVDGDWDKLRALEAVSLHTDHKTLDRREIARLHDKGYRVLVYTVNDAAKAQELFDAGIDGIFTDNLREFAERFPDAIR